MSDRTSFDINWAVKGVTQFFLVLTGIFLGGGPHFLGGCPIFCSSGFLLENARNVPYAPPLHIYEKIYQFLAFQALFGIVTWGLVADYGSLRPACLFKIGKQI